MPQALFLALAVISGVMSGLSFDMEGDSPIAMWLPAIAYGPVVAGWFVYRERTHIWRGLVILALIAGAWWLALNAAVSYAANADEDGAILIAGLIGGLVGATAMYAGLALMYRHLRRQAVGWRTIVAGSVCGLLLGVPSPFVLFIVWQVTVLAALAYTSPRQPTTP